MNMRILARAVLLILSAWNLSSVAFGQAAIGLPTFGSVSSNGPAEVNLANLNVHVALPITSKAGRGLSFVFNVGYDSSMWYPSGTSGSQTWVLTAPLGFSLGLPSWDGAVSYTSTAECFQVPYYGEYCYDSASNYAYRDANGTLHSSTYAYYEICDPGCTGGGSGSLVASDASGYTLSTGGTSVWDRSGTFIMTSSGSYGSAGTIEDTNGNYITANVSGNNYVLTDTLGQQVLTVPQSTSGSTATYATPAGTVTIYLAPLAVKTDFGCSGVSEYGPVSHNLPYMIMLPDGSAYTIAYDYFYDSYGDVYTTGRIASISLPSGGSIYFNYTGTNKGISCSDGTTTNLEVVGPSGDWKYSRSGSQTTATAPQLSYDSASNQTVYTFDANGHETQRQIYQGAAGGTLLGTVSTTWDSNDATPTKTVTTLSQNGSSIESEVDTTYDAYGNLSSETEKGWGQSSPGSPFRTTTYNFTTGYGGIAELLTDETIADGSGTIQYRKDIAYDQTQITNCPTGVVQHDDRGYPCSYNLRGNPTTVTTYTTPATKQGAINKTFSYDVFGNELSAQLNCCQQKIWSYSLDTYYAFPDSVTSGSGSPQLTTYYGYNLTLGAPTTVMDPNSLETRYTFDSSGRPSGEIRPDGQQVTITYVSGSQVTYQGQTYTFEGGTTVTSPLDSSGHTITQGTAIDEFGRPTAVSSGPMTVCYGYDAVGRRWETSNPQSGCPPYNYGTTYWTQTQFDALGRPTKTVLPDGEVTTYSYLIQNALPMVQITDPVGNQREAESDAAGRLLAVYEPDPTNNNSLTLQTTYTYDVQDDLTQVSQGQQTRTYVYDALGRLTSASIPEANGAATTYTYDNFDNLTSRTDPRGVVTNYHYDGLNRLLGISYPTVPQGVSAMPDNVCTTQDGAEQANACLYYDQGGASAYALGKLTSMKDPSGSETYSFDNLGRETSLQKTISSTIYTTTYQYNYAGEITQITYPSGHVVNPSYDAYGRIASVAGNMSGSNVTYAGGFTYNAVQQVTQFEYGNGIYGSLGFSPDRLQLTCLDYSPTNRNGTCTHDSTTIFGQDYSYAQNGGNNGQITGITDDVDNGRSASYNYDALSRLVAATTVGSANYPQWGLSWTYDRYGNRTAQNVTAGTAPAPSFQVNPATNQITTAGYGYDANGNMTNDGENMLSYDGENRVTSSNGSLGTGGYIYDGNGLRVEKCEPNCTTPTSTTVYIFAGSKVVAEYDNGAAPASPSREYAYSGGALLAKFESGALQYYHQDQASVRLITNSSGSVIGQRGDFPYGEQWYATNTTTKWAFTSYERDAESGNDYAMAREYVNRLGRFSALDGAAPDSADPQSASRYPYVENDPINKVDPGGEDWILDGAIIDSGIAPPWSFGFDEFALLAFETSQITGYQNDNSSDCLQENVCNPTPIYGLNLGLFGPPTNPGGPPAQSPVDLKVLKNCISSLYNVATISFVPAQPGSNGSFTGAMAGIFQGVGEPPDPGPSEFTVTTNVHEYSLMDMNPGAPASGLANLVTGETFPSNPFVNYLPSDSSDETLMLQDQLTETGNSLTLITNSMSLTQIYAMDQEGHPPGQALYNCVKQHQGLR